MSNISSLEGFSPIYNRETAVSFKQHLKAFCDSYNAAIKELAFKIDRITVADLSKHHNSDEFHKKLSKQQKAKAKKYGLKSKGNEDEEEEQEEEVEKDRLGKKIKLEPGALAVLLSPVNEDRGSNFQLGFVKEGFRGTQVPVGESKSEGRWKFDAAVPEPMRFVPVGGMGEGMLEASRGTFLQEVEMEYRKECRYMVTMSPDDRFEEGWVKTSRMTEVKLSLLAPERPGQLKNAAVKGKGKWKDRQTEDLEKYRKPTSKKGEAPSSKPSKDKDLNEMDVDDEKEGSEEEEDEDVEMEIDVEEEDNTDEEIKFFRGVTFTSKIGLETTEQESLVLSVNPALYEPPRGTFFIEDDRKVQDDLGTISRVVDLAGDKISVRTRALQRVMNPWGLPNRLPVYEEFKGDENSDLGQIRKEASARGVLAPGMDKRAMIEAIKKAEEGYKMFLPMYENGFRQEEGVHGSSVAFAPGELVRVMAIDADFLGTYAVRDFEGREGRIHGNNMRAMDRPWGLELSKQGMLQLEAEAQAKRVKAKAKKMVGNRTPKGKGKGGTTANKIKKITQKVKDVNLDDDEDVEMEAEEAEGSAPKKKSTAKKKVELKTPGKSTKPIPIPRKAQPKLPSKVTKSVKKADKSTSAKKDAKGMKVKDVADSDDDGYEKPKIPKKVPKKKRPSSDQDS